jgi:hypothetical protein
MVRAANNSEIAKAVVHHTINRLSEGELENTFVTDLYSLFPAAIEMNIQDTNAHTMHSARTANQDSFTEPMSIPAITSRKEINAASLYREVPAVSGRTSRAAAVEYFATIPKTAVQRKRRRQARHGRAWLGWGGQGSAAISALACWSWGMSSPAPAEPP